MSLADALGTYAPKPPPPVKPVYNEAYQETPPEDAEMEGDAPGEEEEEEDDASAKDDDENGDLFGDAEDAEGTPAPDDGLTSPERRKRKQLEYDEEDQEEAQEEIQLKEENVQVPNIPIPKSSDGDYWVIRLPNFVKLDSKPFHPDTYVGPDQDDDEGNTEMMKERSLSIKLEAENTVRWRWTKDEFGNDIKQSNSRIIRWSDGTMSLQLGRELFDINQNIDRSALTQRSALGGGMSSQSQSQSQSQPETGPSAPRIRGAGLTYLVAQHKRAEVLQAEKVITGHLTLRPTGMQSETHRKLVRAVGQKHSRVARLKMAPSELVQRDPNKELAELAKNAAKSRPKSSNRREETFITPKKRRGGGGGRRDLDEEEELADPYDSDEEPGSSQRKGKKGESDERKGGDYQTDDFVVSDEDDDDEEGGGSSRKRARDMDHTKDALEEAEEKLERAERKKNKDTNDEDEEEDADMEVESEEEEDGDDAGIRKPSGPRRRRVAIEEDEDDE